jgi:hypothetical protein
MIERKVSQTIRPSSGSMNLDAGKVSGTEAFVMAGFSLASILVMALGGILLVWASPKYSYEFNAYRAIGMLTGGLISLCGLRFAWSMSSLMLHSWKAYHKRLADWHEAELDMYLDQRGVETITEVSQLELTPNVAGHVLLTALAIQHRLMTQDVRQPLWSVRALEDKLYLDGGTNSILIGELNGTKPERMSETLAQLGLVRNRREGVAGDWVPQSYEDIFSLVARNWHRRKG